MRIYVRVEAHLEVIVRGSPGELDSEKLSSTSASSDPEL